MQFCSSWDGDEVFVDGNGHGGDSQCDGDGEEDDEGGRS